MLLSKLVSWSLYIVFSFSYWHIQFKISVLDEIKDIKLTDSPVKARQINKHPYVSAQYSLT